MSEKYRPWDREAKLGPPPWSPKDPKLQAWEAAHGHDVRLKCLPEFGCLIVQAQEDRIIAAAVEWASQPVIKANADLTEEKGDMCGLVPEAKELYDAVKEAGLLDVA